MAARKPKLDEPVGLHVIMPWDSWIISLRLDEDEAKELAEGRVPKRVQEDCRGMLDWVYSDPDKVFREAKD